MNIDPANPGKTNEYIEEVYQAFNKRCEEIHAETIKQLRATAEDDAEARKKILTDQKKMLDDTLAELKQVLGGITRQTREKLEDMEKKENEKAFDLVKELANV
jgi:hypothetical protein